ncbi:SHOCT domain-containing protein [Microbacterium sp. EYE_5]|nr:MULTISPECIES: SHOCT domain-containing protein [unclassified Microbacterium]MCK6081295.1 SHOCT domain-containing protein [Microbacterium sp. EYE_382]MCK6086565.1 SHOCT domain-containing protein [Microbacterium sp. EYE_384]MCK6123937.1 SHOCT domain-containing protein [Microbacterium sp. EYE_80]MCK6126846.1 SHOCT domain-containing protein [Microbacterium sp. EYE_79]MCK6142250.1 SHOCT domain-containing protein [Microbacterium sp. EYE_39]
MPAQPNDALETLRKLGELRDAGVVTPAEFELKKAELLARL